MILFIIKENIMSISKKSRIVLNEMIKKKIIPETGDFDVTSYLIDCAFDEWNRLYHPNYTEKLKPTAIRYGKKIAGINLMKLNLERIETTQIKTKSKKTKIKCGVVYIITNESFPGYYKIGITMDLDSRLKTYQTYDPFKRYKVEHYSFVSNRAAIEKMLLDKFKLDISAGEWIQNEKIKKEIISLC
jgi:hypothetical protein